MKAQAKNKHFKLTSLFNLSGLHKANLYALSDSLTKVLKIINTILLSDHDHYNNASKSCFITKSFSIYLFALRW